MVAGQMLPMRTVQALQRMVPARQLETVRIMVAQDNLSGDFARALLAATPANERLDDARGRQSHPDCVRRLARTVGRLVEVQKEAALLRARNDQNLLCLTLAAGWTRTWIHDEVVAAWLLSHHPKYAAVLRRIVDDADFAVEPQRHMKLAYEPARRPAVVAAGRRSRRSRRERTGSEAP